ncbi:MAG: DNA cytosine methyltransferase [Candidatus Heimdallarchaeota archaeon]
MTITFLDLFTGCGGFTLGLQQAGLKSLYAIDFFNHAVSTFKYNIGNHIEELDIYEKNLNDLPEVDIVVGSPPCQGFSLEGKRKSEDSRNLLYLKFVETVKLLEPKFFIMENVPGMANIIKGEFFDDILLSLLGTGYNVKYAILNSVNYGVPQFRKRIFIIGSKENRFNFPPITHNEIKGIDNGLKDPVTLGDAILDLPTLKSGEEVIKYNDSNLLSTYVKELKGDCNELYNHKAQKHGKRMVDKMREIPIGGDMRDIQDEYKENKTYYAGGYRRADPNLPSYTVYWTRAMTSVHPDQPRLFTARECARLQSFPDNFIFKGPVIMQYTQISNAVPPYLAREIGNYFIKLINQEPISNETIGIDTKTTIKKQLNNIKQQRISEFITKS